jgi:hypothetical protein
MNDPWSGQQRSRDVVRSAPQPEGAGILSVPRAGDRQRDRYLNHVADCHARGYLDDETFERRRDLILAAQQMPQLQVLIDDLPPLPLERKAQVAERNKQWVHRLNRKPYRGLLHAFAAIPLLLLAILPSVFLGCGNWSADPVTVTFIIVTVVVGVVASIANLIWFMVWATP